MVIHFSFLCAKHWGTGLEVQGHRAWSGRELRSNSFGSHLSNYIIHRAWSPLVRSFAIGAGAHTAHRVCASLVFPPCGILNFWLTTCSPGCTPFPPWFTPSSELLICRSSVLTPPWSPSSLLPGTHQYLLSFQAPEELSNPRPARLPPHILQQELYPRSLGPPCPAIEHLKNYWVIFFKLSHKELHKEVLTLSFLLKT